YVTERMVEESPCLQYAVDLYLACACVRGDAAALRYFDRDVLARVDRVLSRLGLSRADADDVKQEVRTRLLVADGDEPGKLASYQGTGPLVQWVCAVAGRQALGMMRRRKPAAEIGDDLLDAADDPRLLALKTHHRAEFKDAFQDAVSELDPRDRAVLRALVVDDQTVGEIATVYGIHRVTASRWIAKIRASLLRGTRNRLRVALDLNDRDLDSWIRDVDSGLELSLYRLLADGS
ncbi:MAG: sigma-70 family RNA polymerase sigma factor, partial [Candidatus Binatia bacterium]